MDISSAVEELRDHSLVATLRGSHERGESVDNFLPVYPSALLEKCVDDPDVASVSRQRQSCGLPLVMQVEVGLVAEEDEDRVEVVVAAGLHERRPAVHIDSIYISLILEREGGREGGRVAVRVEWM